MRQQPILRYLFDVRPVGLMNGLNYWQAIARAGLSELFLHHRSAGQFILGSRPILLRADGITFSSRPKTTDLTMVALSQDPPSVVSYFVPRQSDAIVDVGANIGAYSLRAARVARIVIAIEPEPCCFSVLEKNIAINNFDNVFPIRCAISDKRGKATFFVHPFETGSHSLVNNVPERSYRLEVETMTLDEALGPFEHLETVDWLKIDVEGSELNVLNGGEETLQKTRRVIVESKAADRGALMSRLLSRGFEVVKV